MQLRGLPQVFQSMRPDKLTGTSARRQDTGGQVAEVGGVPVPPPTLSLSAGQLRRGPTHPHGTRAENLGVESEKAPPLAY